MDTCEWITAQMTKQEIDEEQR